LFPARESGSRVQPKTIQRWALYGIRGIRLESVKVGRDRLTSAEAVQRFIDARSEPPGEASGACVNRVPRIPSDSQSARNQAAAASLAELGL